MAIYKSPNMSFIDAFRDAARYRDANTLNAKKEYIEGMGNLVKGGAEAYKWQKRKDILDQQSKLDDEEKRIREELELLRSGKDFAGSRRNFDAIMAGLDWNMMPKIYKQDGGGLL